MNVDHDFKTNLGYAFGDETLFGLKKFATPLPNTWLTETLLDACFDEAWQTVGGKGADF
ncbi:hypothetical protein [Peribacillus frigoritolerans]|uniref:hypothetical protein n=1 Tax=Peribacillus frigoritolerans TaxID=450367 RepID=UPI003305B47D